MINHVKLRFKAITKPAQEGTIVLWVMMRLQGIRQSAFLFDKGGFYFEVTKAILCSRRSEGFELLCAKVPSLAPFHLANRLSLHR